LVIDALNECDKQDWVEGGTLLPLLVGSLAKLPFRRKILFTGRPEYWITNMFEKSLLQPLHVLVLHAVDPEVVSTDIGLYLGQAFSDISHRRIEGVQ
jgi:hypothetical protein